MTEPGGATGTIHVGSARPTTSTATRAPSCRTSRSARSSSPRARSEAMGRSMPPRSMAGSRGGRDGGWGGPKFRVGPERPDEPRGEPRRHPDDLIKRQLTFGRRLINAARLPSGPRRVFDSQAVLTLRRFDGGRSHFPRPHARSETPMFDFDPNTTPEEPVLLDDGSATADRRPGAGTSSGPCASPVERGGSRLASVAGRLAPVGRPGRRRHRRPGHRAARDLERRGDPGRFGHPRRGHDRNRLDRGVHDRARP